MVLAVLPALKARREPGGGFTLTQKFIDGMREYRNAWDVPTTVVMEPTEAGSTNLDEVEVDPASLPFRLEVMSYDDPALGPALAGHRVVLGTVSYRQNHLSTLCRSIGVPCVYVSECTLKTRGQIVRADTQNPLLVLRRLWWQINQERLHRRAIRLATGIQCNGTPTFEDYRAINPRPHLFFDTRVTDDMLAAEDELGARFEVLRRGGPIRLLFSGRLVRIKGVDHLVQVASELRRLGVPFEFTICGDGDLEPRIRAEIGRLGLGDCTKLAGVLEFKSELVPLTRRQADLFVCCHRSGDPSCTYLEVMSCGVPIVGYDNEAFRGIVRESGAGWLVPMDRPLKVAEQIARLSADRDALIDAARKALEFGRRHTFRRTVRGRIEHMKACAETVP